MSDDSKIFSCCDREFLVNYDNLEHQVTVQRAPHKTEIIPMQDITALHRTLRKDLMIEGLIASKEYKIDQSNARTMRFDCAPHASGSDVIDSIGLVFDRLATIENASMRADDVGPSLQDVIQAYNSDKKKVEMAEAVTSESPDTQAQPPKIRGIAPLKKFQDKPAVIIKSVLKKYGVDDESADKISKEAGITVQLERTHYKFSDEAKNQINRIVGHALLDLMVQPQHIRSAIGEILCKLEKLPLEKSSEEKGRRP